MSKRTQTDAKHGAALSGPVVAVDIDGKRGAWCDGFFTGHPEIIAKATWAVAVQWPVEWGRMPALTTADDQTPLGALAALVSMDPDRAVITHWPDHLRETWESEHRACGLERWSA